MEYEQYQVPPKEEDNLTHYARKVFSTEDGQKLLQELWEKFVCSPVALVGYDKHYPYFREGQNDIVRQFFKAIEAKYE